MLRLLSHPSTLQEQRQKAQHGRWDYTALLTWDGHQWLHGV